MTKEIGKSGVTSAMASIGIDMSSESNVTNLSYAIGGWNKGISPLEMASAYATISNNGLYTESHTINYVEVVQTGETFEIDKEIQNNAKQSDYSKASAFMIRHVMLDYTKMVVVITHTYPVFLMLELKQEHPTGEAVLKRYGWKKSRFMDDCLHF